jgi:uncharacterized membrane protein
MAPLTALLVALHALAAVVWVGGMFFAHFALRPSLPVLEPPQPLRLWTRVFPAFFRFVWVAAITLVATGYALMFDLYGGFGEAPVPVHLMQGLGLLMVAIFAFLYFLPFPRFLEAAGREAWPEAARHQAFMRRIVVTNLTLGLTVVVLGAAGRYL